jgi:Flp pilus assembly protein TadG
LPTTDDQTWSDAAEIGLLAQRFVGAPPEYGDAMKRTRNPLSRLLHVGCRRWLDSVISRRANEGGAAMVEFAIVVPLLILLLCGTLDFGLIFGGYMSMENGVASAARTLSLDANKYSSSTSCSGGATAATADAVCNIVANLGSLTGLNSSTLAVGICFVPPGSTPSCGGASSTGTSVSDDVLVCVRVAMESTTGLTSVFVSGSTVSSSSRQLMEEPQPSAATAFQSYNSSSTAVNYNGKAVPGLTCT